MAIGRLSKHLGQWKKPWGEGLFSEMEKFCRWCAGAFFIFLLGSIGRGQEIFPVEAIKPGMRGVTYTVIQGNEILKLETEILGVAWDRLGPGRHMIVGKLVDDRTKLTGAVHGMSGSPLYIDGKLAGALSRRIAAFEKDGHCGFTPIKDMLDVGRRKGKSGIDPIFRPALTKRSEEERLAGKGREASEVFLGLPLSLTGWREEWIDWARKALGDTPGLLLMAGADGGKREDKEYPLEPGAPLAAVLVSGDITMAATGTLTWKQGNEVLAFGHPMMGLGPVEVPLASAEIITTVPSYLRPYKMANIGKLAGVIRQDRLSAVAGEIGSVPEMASYEIHRRHNGEERPVLRGSFVKDAILSPLLLRLLLLRSMLDEQDISSDFSMRLRGELAFKGLPPLRLSGIYSGGMEQKFRAILDQIMSVGELYTRFPKRLEANSLKLEVETVEEGKVWRLREVEVKNPVVRCHDDLVVVVRLENRLGEVRSEEMNVSLPESIKSGQFFLRVAGGQDLDVMEQSLAWRWRTDALPEEVIRSMNRHFESDALYVQVVTEVPGLVVKGRKQPNLPLSVRDVVDGGKRVKSGFRSLDEKVWLESKHQWYGLVSGSKIIGLLVE